MEKLPSYEATTASSSAAVIAPATPQRSIQDLRAQIVANGTLIIQYQCSHGYSSSEHIEVIVAQTPPSSSPDLAMKTRFFTPEGKLARQTPSPYLPHLPGETIGSKYYAVLVRRRGNDSKISIIMKTKPKETVEEALQTMLTMTMCNLHDKVVEKGTVDKDGCVVM